MINIDRWGKIRNAFDDWSFEDVYTLRKAIVLKQVDTYWEQGFLHVAHLQLLAQEFRYDDMLQKIYQHMLIRANDTIKLIQSYNREITMFDIEMIFKDQPFLYNEDVRKGHINTVLYDVKKCSYKRRIQNKYSKLHDVIEDMVNV